MHRLDYCQNSKNLIFRAILGLIDFGTLDLFLRPIDSIGLSLKNEVWSIFFLYDYLTSSKKKTLKNRMSQF